MRNKIIERRLQAVTIPTFESGNSLTGEKDFRSELVSVNIIVSTIKFGVYKTFKDGRPSSGGPKLIGVLVYLVVLPKSLKERT